MFASVDEVQSRFRQRQYIASRRIATVVYLATRMNRPILVEGPAGVGKTELSKVLAESLERPLIRLQCYEGLDEARALYEWSYGKQMLYAQLLREKTAELLGGARGLKEALAALRGETDAFFSEEFLLARPILRAITSERPAVLLIDEIDRSDEEFEAFLLEVLAERQVTIPEVGTIRARHAPRVALTSNDTRELSDALRRRCLYLYLDYPSFEDEVRIVERRVPGVGPELRDRLVRFVHGLRRADLKRPPGTAEVIDWAAALAALGAETLSDGVLAESLGALLKRREDLEQALKGKRY
jgi:MoxR-like ATPase